MSNYRFTYYFQIKIQLLKDNDVRREIVFERPTNGWTDTDWFRPQNIANSSWSGLDPTISFISFKLKRYIVFIYCDKLNKINKSSA